MMKLDALYYPQIALLNETLLKYLLLVFDRITFLPNDIDLSPNQVTIRDRFSINDDILFSAFGSREDCRLSGMYASEGRFWDDEIKRLMDAYDVLEGNGICIPIRDRAFGDYRQLHPLTPFVDADMQDIKFVKYCESALNKRLIIAGDPQASIKGGGFVIRSSRYKGKEGFAALCSERINSTLYFAGTEDLIPVSNQEFFIQLLRLKLEHGAKDEDYLRERGLWENRRRITLGLLSYEIIVDAVPPEALENKTMQQILNYRTECKEAQERFRKHLSGLESELMVTPWDTGIRRRVDRLVREKIRPEIEQVSIIAKVMAIL
jgi:hypothetical protein